MFDHQTTTKNIKKRNLIFWGVRSLDYMSGNCNGRSSIYIQDDSKGHVQNEIRDRGPHGESGKVGYLRSKMHQF